MYFLEKHFHIRLNQSFIHCMQLILTHGFNVELIPPVIFNVFVADDLVLTQNPFHVLLKLFYLLGVNHEVTYVTEMNK